MKNVLAMLAGSVLLFGALSSGGCVSAEEFNQLKARNDRLVETLEKTQDRLRQAEAEIANLKGELAARDRLLQLKEDQIASLTASNADMRAKLDAALKTLADLGKMPLQPLGPLPPGLNEALRKLALDHPDLFEFDERNGMVRVKADLTFELGSVAIKAQAAAALKKLAQILNSKDALQFNVYVAGHTDDVPLVNKDTIAEHKDNWGLSLHRAKAVAAALYDGGQGVDQTRLGAIGFSMYHPIATNAPNRKGNESNRRVEIWIVPPSLLLSGPTAGAAAPSPGRASEKAGGGN